MEQEITQSSVKNEVWEWAKALLIAAVLVFVIRYFIFAPFIVDGPSMQPNFKTGERLIVNKIIYSIREPHRGEVVVFHAPEGKDYIKRVVGLPGDEVKVEGDVVSVNGKALEEKYIKYAVDEMQNNGGIYNTGPNFPNEMVQDGKVPEGSIFVMGDNRGNSKDGREIGYIAYDKVIGRADIIFWPIDNISLVKH
ncbi:signal peptidase I [Paenibacillus swuensis]|uniref:Signal peptidase I n=1 Tax=Paenibacillus swuensis TaxID=1178515 RepID=A0A172TKH4_9BACL|nr:signal peptidase I [Paenibacillus swuensis]ANE47520.1 signal peptidase I [Paenibacillus swuensis]